MLFFCVFDQILNQLGVHLRVNVFNHNLKTVETADLGGLDLRHEPLDQVLVDDAVRGGEKGQNMFDEKLFPLFQLFPIVIVTREVDLFSRPERGNGLFVEAPNV